jgi:hypothetical protein
MKSVAVFMLFVGMFLILQGYYSQQAEACPAPTVQVKYVPRSVYEDQLSDDQKVGQQFKSLFEDIAPWPTVRG